MPDLLAELFSPSAAAALSDPMSFVRGDAYWTEGRIENLAVSRNHCTATVRGSVPYGVELWEEGGEPAWSCECPVGETGAFCKHCVAVALALFGDADEDEQDESVDRTDDGAALTRYVRGLDQETLASLVIEQAVGDWRLRERLVAAAASATGAEIDLASWRGRLADAFQPDRGFVDYGSASGWADDVNGVLDAVAHLLDAGQGEVVIALTEHAQRLAEAAIEYVDDSDGWIAELAARIGELHLAACTERHRTRSSSLGDWSISSWARISTRSTGRRPATPPCSAPPGWQSTGASSSPDSTPLAS